MTATKPVADWNVRDFTEYLSAEHLRLYGVSYQPFKGWRAESGILGRIVGTKRKAGERGPELTKRFIDRCFAEYRPNAKYPGLSFGFMSTYMAQNWQRVEAEVAAEEKAAERRQQAAIAEEDIENWL